MYTYEIAVYLIYRDSLSFTMSIHILKCTQTVHMFIVRLSTLYRNIEQLATAIASICTEYHKLGYTHNSISYVSFNK